MTLCFSIPLRTRSAANLREHWAQRHRRVQMERTAVRLVVGRKLKGLKLPCRVHLIRMGPRRLDFDNLVSSFKATRDEVAALIGVDDADPRIEWAYSQTSGRYAVIVQVSELAAETGK